MIQQVWPVCETRTEDMYPHETLELIAPGAHVRDWCRAANQQRGGDDQASFRPGRLAAQSTEAGADFAI